MATMAVALERNYFLTYYSLNELRRQINTAAKFKTVQFSFRFQLLLEPALTH